MYFSAWCSVRTCGQANPMSVGGQSVISTSTSLSQVKTSYKSSPFFERLKKKSIGILLN